MTEPIEPSDPRRAGGDVVGASRVGDEVILDARHAVILTRLTIAIMNPAEIAGGPAYIAVLLGGRINLTEEESRVLYMVPAPAVAELVVELLNITRDLAKAGISEFRDALRDRLRGRSGL